MLTGRGWWLFTVALFALGISLLMAPMRGYLITLFSLSVISWFVYEWLRFRWRMARAVPALQTRRRIRVDQRSVSMVWAGRPFEVQVLVGLYDLSTLPLVHLRDVCRGPADSIRGTAEQFAALKADHPVQLQYQLVCAQPGVLRFEGVAVQLADRQGFFYHRVFLRDPLELVILPPLSDAAGHQRADKRYNLLLPPGIHRLRKPGSGSELLDLRDYRPGDPPKMIAWKASARRDRLITKEFENEVPVRVTLFVDASASVRLGPPGETNLVEMVRVAAALAQAAIANRDLVGISVFDEQQASILRPERGSRHLVEAMRRLAIAAGLPPPSPPDDEDPRGNLGLLTRVGLEVADTVYPELFRSDANRTPWKMFWRPLLDKRWAWIVLLMFVLPLLVLWPPYRQLMAMIASLVNPERNLLLISFILVSLAPALLATLFWGIFGIRGLFSPLKRELARRKRLAAVLSQWQGLGAGGIALLMEDDQAYQQTLKRFLAAHRVPYSLSLYDRRGRYRFASPQKSAILARTLVHAVARAKDNELFVILADLLELDDALSPVIGAVRAALARHHQVLVVCPWLAGMPSPEDVAIEELEAAPSLPKDLPSVLHEQLILRYLQAYQHVRQAFGRLGVTVVRLNQGDAVERILNRLERLRGVSWR